VRDRADDVRARLRAGHARWNRGALEGAEAFWHEHIVWEEAPQFPDAAVRRGRDACVARLSERLSLLGKVQIEVGEIDLHEDRALVEVVVRGQGVTSGVPAERREYFLYDFADDGRIIRWREFLERGPAEATLRNRG
jgi:ketosteroid isomerase-like protein